MAGSLNIYTDHFRLTERPFTLVPDPDFLFWSGHHKRAFSMLEYGLMIRAPITLLTGEVGAGKTTLLHHFLRSVDEDLVIGMIANAHGDRGELLHWVLLALDQAVEPSDGYVKLFNQLQTYLIEEYARGRRVVLIFDEAQNLSLETLEELRMFTNINSNKDELLQLILVGQPELRKTVRHPSLHQFAQRVASSVHLPAMDAQMVKAYIDHRLQVAGATRSIFTATAAGLIHEATSGVPRLVNQLCDLALVYAYTRDLITVQRLTVQQVLDDGVFFGTRPPEPSILVLGDRHRKQGGVDMDLGFYFALFLRRLPYFLIFLVLGTAAGVTIAKVLPPVYVARAVLVVESAQIPSNLASSTVQTGATEALQIIQRRILTRANLLEMANRLRIYDAPGSPDRSKMTADAVVSDLRRRIGIVTSGGARRGTTQATIVTVSFQAPTGGLAATVANEIVTLILEENKEIRTAVAGQTLEFFEQEVDRLDRELTRRSASILAFQEKNMNALPDSLDFRRSQQSASQERLVQLERAEAVLRDRRARLEDLYEATGEVAPLETAQQTSEQQRLATAQRELDSMLVILSPQNPQVRVMQARVDALTRAVAAQKANAPVPDGSDISNPQLSAYQLQLADIDGQLEFIADQKAQITKTMTDLQDSIEATPGNAIQLQTMQRDFAAVRAQYDEAVSNRAAAETGDTIEALSKGQRISVIEQAVAPANPDSPNRPMVAAAGVFGGFTLGVGLVVLLELMNSAIRRPKDLQAKLGIVPFGTLPYIRTKGQLFRRRSIILCVFLVVAAGVPAGLWYVHTEITPLDLLLDRVLDRLNIAAQSGFAGHIA